MNVYPTRYSPTLWTTLAEIWAVSRAIWSDYRAVARARRRHARGLRAASRSARAAFTTPTASLGSRWQADVLFVTAVCAFATLLGLYSAGLLPLLWAWLVRALANLGGVQ